MMHYKIIQSKDIFKDNVIVEIAQFEQVGNAIDYAKFYFKKFKHLGDNLKIEVFDLYTQNNVFSLEN